jgi:phosphatidylserine decarboxylase
VSTSPQQKFKIDNKIDLFLGLSNRWKIIQFGELVDKIEQVKGHDYEFEEFLGPIDPNHKPENKLYQVIIFFRPTDYHCFNSPADWEAYK